MTKMKKENIFITKAILFLILLIFAVSGTGCSLFKKKYEKTETEAFTINTYNKTKISLDNSRGDIRIFRNTSDSMLRIKIEKITHVKEKDLDKPIQNVRVKIDTSGSVVNINTEYYKETSFFNISFDDENRINFELYIPDGNMIVIDNNSGDLYMTDITNDVNADIKNGDVKLEKVYGNTNLEVKNGKVTGDLDSTKGLNIDVKNGKVNLNLGESFSGKFKLDIANGKIIKDEFGFTDVSEEKKSFEGKLGDKDVEVVIDVANGKITLSKR